MGLAEFAPPLALAAGTPMVGAVAAAAVSAAAAAAPAPSGVAAKKRKRKRKRAKVEEAPQPAEAPALRAPDSGAHASAQPIAASGPEVWKMKKDKRRVDWVKKVEELEKLKKEKAERLKREAEARKQRQRAKEAAKAAPAKAAPKPSTSGSGGRQQGVRRGAVESPPDPDAPKSPVNQRPLSARSPLRITIDTSTPSSKTPASSSAKPKLRHNQASTTTTGRRLRDAEKAGIRAAAEYEAAHPGRAKARAEAWAPM